MPSWQAEDKLYLHCFMQLYIGKMKAMLVIPHKEGARQHEQFSTQKARAITS